MKFVVGLTGGIGSGKSAVAELFARRGIFIVDTDAIAHELTASGGGAMRAIQASFGSDFITPEGALDRQRMRNLVFRDPQSKRLLESILHPRIRARSTELIASADSPYVILVVPLLVETGIDRTRYQRVLTVDCDEEKQIERVMQRNNLSTSEVRRVMATQATRAARLAVADDVLTNNAGLEDLAPKVDELHLRYLELAGGRPPRGG